MNISVIVSNTGEQTGKYSVVLKINNAVEETKEVTLAAGANQKVTFTVTGKAAGTYAVDVSGLTGSFTVTEEAVVPPVHKTNWLLIILIVVALAVIAGLVGYILWRRHRYI